MWEFLVKKTFPLRPAKQGTDVSEAHSVTDSHNIEKVDGDTKQNTESHRTEKKKARTLNCPVCSVNMELRMIGNLQIDQCPRCEGIFLDRGELQILSGIEDNFFQKEDHKYLIYTPHGLSDSIKPDEKNDS